MSEDFFIAELPWTGFAGHYNWWLVLLSYTIVSITGFIAIVLVAGLRNKDEQAQGHVSMLGALFTGGGIWSMHFTGAFAYQMTMAHTFSAPMTIVSLVIALVFSWWAFEQILRPVLTKLALVHSSIVVGTGIVLMHYTGMTAMVKDADLHYRLDVFVLSAFMAIIAAGTTILILRQFVGAIRMAWSVPASGLIGLLLLGLHHVGMETAVFLPRAESHSILDHTPTWVILIVTSFVFVLIIVPGFVVSLNNLVTRSRSTGETKTPRWHYVNYVLAGFTIATILLGFVLSQRIMDIYGNSAQASTEWSERQRQIVEISRQIASANSPGNDVFASKNVEGEQRKLETTIAILASQYKNILTQLNTLGPQDVPAGNAENGMDYKTILISEVTTSRAHLEKMVEESYGIFIAMKAADPGEAGAHMAVMDGHFRDTSAHLSNVIQIISEVQIRIFDEHVEQANVLRSIRYMMAVLILVLVASATFYGHRLSRTVRREEEKKQFQRKMLDLISIVQSTYISGESDDESKVFEVLISKLTELTNSDFGFIGEVLHSENEDYDLDVRAVSGVIRSIRTQANDHPDESGSVYDRAIRTGEPLIDSRPILRVPGDEKSNTGSLTEYQLAIPVFVGNHVVGIVGLASKTTKFSQRDIVILDPLFRTIETIVASIHDRRKQDITDGRLAESAQISAQTTNRFQGILDNTEALIYMKDAQGRVLLANKKLCLEFGSPEAELLGKTDYDFLPRKYADELAKTDKKILDSLEPTKTEEVVALRGRKPRHFLSMKFPLYDEMLGEYIVCGISTDITEIKRTQKSLEESNAWLDSIMHTVPEGILTFDSDGTISSVNRAICEIFGYSKSELEQFNVSALLPEKSRGRHFQLLEEDFQHDSDKENELVSIREAIGLRKDGTEVPLEVSLSLVGISQEDKYAIVSVRDITAKKLAEEELERHRDHLQDMVDEQTRDLAVAHDEAEQAHLESESFANISKNNPYPIVKLNQSGEVILFNPSADRLFDDLEERGADHPFLSGAMSMLENVGVVDREITVDGITYLQTIVVTNTRDSRVVTFYSIDVTPIKTAQREAEWANRMKSEFLGNMSHELRTPMHAIISFSRHGMERIERWDKDKQVENLDRINQSGRRLSGMLNDLLDLTKLEAGNAEYDFKSVDIVSIINAAASEIDILANNKSQSLILPKSPSGIPRVECDRGKIHQVVVNLMSNAIKFTPEGKRVSVSCSENVSESAMRITVSDEGVGIPEDELDSVFDKFIQSSVTKTGAGGTGLGLAICKEIVEGHGGQIWAENNSHGGADFHVAIPMVQEAQEAGEQAWQMTN